MALLCIRIRAADGLNFEEKQAKYTRLQERAEDHAARVFQCCARCKLAKRHLLRKVQHWDEAKRVKMVERRTQQSHSHHQLQNIVKFHNPIAPEDSDELNDTEATATETGPNEAREVRLCSTVFSSASAQFNSH